MTDNVSESIESIESIESTESRAPESDAQNLDNSPGAQLRRARAQAGLSCEELSRRLCMTGNKLELLERDEYDRLPGALYVRGYIRNACKELKLDPEPVLQAFSGFAAAEEESREILAHVSRGPVVGEGRKRSYKGLALLPLVAVAGIFWWVNDRGLTPPALTGSMSALTAAADEVAAEPGAAESTVFASAAMPAEAAEQPLPGESADPLATEPAVSEAVADDTAAVSVEVVSRGAETATTAESADTGTGVTEEPSFDPAPVVDSAPATEPVQTVDSAPTADSAQTVAATESIQLQFDEDAWIEVKDATGSVLLAKLKPAGSQVTLEGQPPFSLMLGNAVGTQVRYRGELVDSAPIGNRRTRRLTVGD